jgi:hypothetical protein
VVEAGIETGDLRQIWASRGNSPNRSDIMLLLQGSKRRQTIGRRQEIVRHLIRPMTIGSATDNAVALDDQRIGAE